MRIGLGSDTRTFVRRISIRRERLALRRRSDDVDEALTADPGVEQVVGF
jgi:hypothetical protein